jgi:hypothetical protein
MREFVPKEIERRSAQIFQILFHYFAKSYVVPFYVTAKSFVVPIFCDNNSTPHLFHLVEILHPLAIVI